MTTYCEAGLQSWVRHAADPTLWREVQVTPPAQPALRPRRRDDAEGALRLVLLTCILLIWALAGFTQKWGPNKLFPDRKNSRRAARHPRMRRPRTSVLATYRAGRP